MADVAGEQQTVSLRCFGAPQLSFDKRQRSLSNQHTRLLSVLVAAGPSGLGADGILDALWGEKTPKSGTQAVYALANRLADKHVLLVNESGRYRIAASVDVDTWDFDALVDRDDVDAQLLGLGLWRGRPFDDVEAGDIVAGEASRLLRKRISVTESVARNASREQLRGAEGRILGATNDDPYNEPLVIAAASALYRLNKRRDALSVLQSCRARLRGDLGLGGSAELDAAELALLNDENPIPAIRDTAVLVSPRIDPLPLILAPRADLFVGRTGELDQLNHQLAASLEPGGRGRVVVLNGGAGIGKSELVAQFATDSEGLQVRVGTNATGSSAAYGAWIKAVPEASDALVKLSSAQDPSSANLVFWRDVEYAIHELASHAPLVIVLEDMHQSDPQSMLLFSWLASGSLPSRVLLLATTRPPEEGSSWAGTINELRGRQDTDIAAVIDVEPLPLSAIHQMVAARFPGEPVARVHRFASQVHALSQGNPLVSSALIKDSDEPTDLVTGTDRSIEEHHAQSVRGRVDSAVSGVLTNAGLVGQEFDLEVVASISEMSSSTALVHLETAMAAGLVLESEELGRFRFDHILTAEAFAQRASRLRRAQTYRSLLGFDDLPAADRVRYIRGAFLDSSTRELVDAAELLRVEAVTLAGAASFSEARSALEYAIEFLGAARVDPDFDLLLLRAEVTARAGDLTQTEVYRQDAFDMAAGAGSIENMARATVVGLPTIERHEGDESLFALFEQINPNDINDAGLRGTFVHHYLRQSRFFEAAEGVFTQMAALPRTNFGDTEAWAEFRNECLQIEHQFQPKRESLTELDELMGELEPGRARTTLAFRALLFSVQLMDESFVCRFDQARAELLRHPVPRMQWAFELVESMLGIASLAETESTPESVLATGFRLGVADAFTSFGAQSWQTLWFERRFEEALALLEGAKGLIEPNVGWQSAEAFNLAAVGRSGEARQLATEAAAYVKRHPRGPWAAPASALLVEAAGFLDDSADVAKAAADVLAPHSGTAVVLGTGVAHLGPADMLIGRALEIAGDDSAEGFMARGQRQADRIGFMEWQKRS